MARLVVTWPHFATIQFTRTDNTMITPNFITSLAIATILAAPCASAQELGTTATKKTSAAEKPTSPSPHRYTCVMHSNVASDEPGKCPKCGMSLVPVKPKPDRKPEKHDTHDMKNGIKTPPHQMSMPSSINIAEPMNRESSGTAWVPDSTPILLAEYGD